MRNKKNFIYTILINEKQTNIIKQNITVIIMCYTFGLISITKIIISHLHLYLEALSMLFKNLFPPILRLLFPQLLKLLNSSPSFL